MLESLRLIPWDTSLFCLHYSHCSLFPIVSTWVSLKFVSLDQDFCLNCSYIANCPPLKLDLPQIDLLLFLHCNSQLPLSSLSQQMATPHSSCSGQKSWSPLDSFSSLTAYLSSISTLRQVSWIIFSPATTALCPGCHHLIPGHFH